MFRILLVVSLILTIPQMVVSQQSRRVPLLNNLGSIPFVDGKTVVEEIVFEGIPYFPEYEVQPVTETKLLKVLREGRLELETGSPFSGGSVARAVSLIRKVVVDEGFTDARPRAFGLSTSKNGMRLLFDLNLGLRPRVVGIEFDGNDSVPTEILAEKLKSCIGADWTVFKAAKYSYFARECVLKYYWSQGFHKTRIGELKTRSIGTEIVVSVPIAEGRRYRLGRVDVRGAREFTPTQIRDWLGIKAGDIVDGTHVRAFIYKSLKRQYLEKGHLLFDADFDPNFSDPPDGEADGIVDLKIEIDEGPVFRIRSVSFRGIGFSYDGRFGDRFPVRAGSIFSQSDLERGMEIIGAETDFCKPDPEQDVEIKTSDEDQLADVVIGLMQCG